MDTPQGVSCRSGEGEPHAEHACATVFELIEGVSIDMLVLYAVCDPTFREKMDKLEFPSFVAQTSSSWLCILP